MRIAVFGSGGVGGYFGGRLAVANHDVTFIARGEHLQAIRSDGLRVESGEGDFLIKPAQATDHPAEVGPVDLIVVGVKAWQVPAAAREIKPMVGPETVVMPLQNGVDAPSQLAAQLGQQSVIGGLCKIVSYVISPGHIRHAGFRPSITIGELDNRKSDRIEQIQEVFTSAGVEAAIASDIQVALWQKFLFISAFSGVGAVANQPAGLLRSNHETRDRLLKAMEETCAVAAARHIPMPGDSIDKAMASIDGLPESATSSMQRDIAAGKPSELEAQNGAIVRMAHELNINVPIHEQIYRTLKPLENRARGRIA